MATSATYDTVILGLGNNTGIEVPDEVIAQLGSGKRPPVRITVQGYRYQSTVAVMNGQSLISLSKAHREAAGLAAGDPVTVTLELDDAPRTVDVPTELAAALQAAGLTEKFAGLSFTRRKEYARSVAEAKAEATRDRRIAKVIDELG